MSKRCNGKTDCSDDNSDEFNCTIFSHDNTYSAKHHPEDNSNDSNNDNENKLVQVNVSMHIKNIFDINELSMEYKVRVLLTMEWYDPRITFRNLKDQKEENIISLEESNHLWLPSLCFKNSNLGERTKVDSETSFHIKKHGLYRHNKITEIHEDYIYDGIENPLVLSRYYTVALTCGFELKLYPFDHQECPIELEVPFEHATHMKLFLASQPTYDNSIKFLQYRFVDISTKADNNSTTITAFLHLNR